MDKISVHLKDGKTNYRPGERIRGEIEWDLSKDVKEILINIFWYTIGRGDQDSEIAATKTIKMPLRSERQSFEMELPLAPYSYSGQITTLKWAVEAVTLKGKVKAVEEFDMTPKDKEIILPKVQQQSSGIQNFFQKLKNKRSR